MAGLKNLVDSRAMLVPLDLDQYHRMIQVGILPEGEPIELLDGYMVRKDRSKAGADPMTVGHEHVWVVGQLPKLLQATERHGCHVRTQAPIAIPPDSEPEPDASIVRGALDDYRQRHPGPADVLCVIEVADSSLQRDRTTKLRIYADAGIEQYIIVNLVDRVAEEHRRPVPGEGRYELVRTLSRGEHVSFNLPDGHALNIPVAQLLP